MSSYIYQRLLLTGEILMIEIIRLLSLENVIVRIQKMQNKKSNLTRSVAL